MASDLSSVCTDDIEIFDEKEEGEISLEDVSSSEESRPNYRLGFRNGGRCTNCSALQQCSPWCNSARIARRKFHLRQDADHGKENRRSAKDTSGGHGKHSVSTLQEKNDDEDLVPISSDSDMETVGLPGNSIHVATRALSKSSKVRKKKKKKRSHGSSIARLEDGPECVAEAYGMGEEAALAKALRVGSSRSHHRESTSPRFNVASASLLETKLLRSPSRRYRSSARGAKSRSPLRRSRSPVLNHANSTARKLSRKLRSSRRNASRSPVRFDFSRESRDSASSPSHVDIYASKLLRKVRRLESVGNFSPESKRSRSKEHSSLKEKLDNMMKNEECVVVRGDKKKPSSRRGVVVSMEHENNNVAHRKRQAIDDCKDDEEDDIESLRRAALETKPKKREENKSEETTKGASEPLTRLEVNLSDDNDSEALELRMIALRSAVMNKHRNRVKRGLGSKNRRFDAKSRNESPFGRSFLDAIPIPDELSDTSGQSPISKSPARNDEANNPEDMELDTDVEREKDSMPYSPTDDLTIGKIDNETTVAQPRPVLNDETIDPTNYHEESRVTEDSIDHETPIDARETASTDPKISTLVARGANEDAVTRRSSPERARRTSLESLVNYLENSEAPCSPSKPMEPSKIDRASRSPAKSVINVETPYSPTDAPIYDPELTRFSPGASVSLAKDARAHGTSKNIDETSASGGETTLSRVSSNLVPMMLNMSMNDDECPKDATAPNDRVAERPFPVNAASDFYSNDNDNMQFYDAIIDELPDIDLDGSPLVPVTKESSSVDFGVAPSENPDPQPSSSSEPLYLQGLPEVTREANKIPTLVNMTLVPSAILKTNKQLQQPLPPKKFDGVAEPSFKSADMRPVSDTEIAGLKSTKTFKPIKLCPLAKKPQVIATNVAAFNSSLGDDTISDGSANGENSSHTRAEAIKAVDRKSTTPSNASSSSTTLRKPKDLEEASVKSGSPSVDEFAPHSRRYESTDTARPRSTGKVKAKSVEKYLGDRSNDRTNSSRRSVARRASSSPVLRQRISPKPRERTSLVTDPPMKKSDKTARRDSVESGSEANASKAPRKRKIRRAARKLRPSRESTESEPGKGAGSVARRSRESTEKNRSETMDPDKSVDSNVERNDNVDPEVKRSAEGSVASASLESGNMEDKNRDSRSSDKPDENDEADKKRRGSLDEDEEALRALLLASLPKRAKVAESTTPETINPIVRVTRLSDPTTTDTSPENATEKSTKALGGNDSPTFTTPTTLALSSQSSSAATSSATSNKVADCQVAISKNVDAARKILTSETNQSSSNSSVTASPLTPRKRSGSVASKNPPKKIMKKALPALASARVVNNAKKYQNAMLQKRLNSQRAATSYNGATGSRNITLNNIKSYETARPSSPKITNASSKTQRLVINLESDTDSDNEPITSRLETKPSTSGNDATTSEQRKPLAIPTTDFEESVVQFLKDQRKKIESNAVTTSSIASTVTTTSTKSPLPSSSGVKDIGMYSTPLAVRRHLPVSQQEEYRRLKQQIIERERQIQKTIDNGSNSPSSPASPSVATAAPPKSYAPRVAPQVSVTNVALNGKKSQEKMDSNGARSNVTKVSKAIVPEVSVPSVSNIPAFSKVAPRSANVNETAGITSTPKSRVEIAKFASTTKVSSSNDAAGKNAVQPKTNSTTVTKIHPESATRSAKIASVPSRMNGPSMPSAVITRNGSLPSVSPATSVNAAGSVTGSSSGCLRGPQTLTIRIPNDKIQAGGSSAAAAKNKKDETPEASVNSPKSLGALKILTKEQLNDRSVEIRVERSSGDRRVTVAPARSLRDSPSPSIDAFATSTLPKCPDNRSGRSLYCDSSLSLNERCEAKRTESIPKNDDESSIDVSEASTLVLSRNENVAGNDSNASTLVLSHEASQIRENLESTRLCVSEEEDSMNSKGKQNKTEVKEGWEKIRSDVKEELKILETLSASRKEQLLVESQENLVAKRNMVLEDLTEMTRYLRQLEFEREIQTKLVAEVRRLREELKSAEDRLNDQRRQMNEMGPMVTRTHKKINHGRRECYRMSRICQGLGTQVVGPNYKVPVTNAHLLNEQLKEVAAYTRQLSKKKVPALNNVLNNARDELLSPAIAGIESTPDNSIASMNETVNRLDTPGTSMSETDNNVDTRADAVPQRENESSTGDTVEPINEETKDSSSTRPPDAPGEQENEESSTIEAANPSNEVETACSADGNESIGVIEVSNVSETNAPYEKTEALGPMETCSRSEETEVARSPETNASTSQVEISNSSDSNAPPRETEASRLTEANEASKETERSCTNSSCPVVESLTTRNFFIDTTESNEPAGIGGPSTSTGTNFVSIFRNAAVDNRNENHFPMVNRRSEPPSFPVLKDTHTSVRKTRGRYTSVLTHFRTLRNADPNGILCPYELMGTCNDGDCQYYHFDPDRQCQ